MKANPLLIKQLKSNKYTDSHIRKAWKIPYKKLCLIRKHYNLPSRIEVIRTITENVDPALIEQLKLNNFSNDKKLCKKWKISYAKMLEIRKNNNLSKRAFRKTKRLIRLNSINMHNLAVKCLRRKVKNERDLKIVAMYNNGADVLDIAKEFNLTFSYIELLIHLCRKSGIEVVRRHSWDNRPQK